jgi:release factor glutamine methyltransferase
MGVKIQTIKDIRFYLAKELKAIYKEPEIRILADIIIKNVTGITKLHQLYNNKYILNVGVAQKVIEFVEELKTGKPIQYVIGETVFYDCVIKVNRSTLIPRPETEELVDLIIRENQRYNGHIIDIGTGSGCIAVALAANIRSAALTGIEISEEAIKIAAENAVLNNVKISLIKGDIFNLDAETVSKAGMIVSNPPYVRNSEKAHMAKNVLDFEPHQALFVTDSDPLMYYNAILKLAEKVLLPRGLLYFEINEAMGRSLQQLFDSFDYSDIKVFSDINDKERIIRGRKNG